jgi:hypothetical protein
MDARRARQNEKAEKIWHDKPHRAFHNNNIAQISKAKISIIIYCHDHAGQIYHRPTPPPLLVVPTKISFIVSCIVNRARALGLICISDFSFAGLDWKMKLDQHVSQK